jgi:hypothetical protein
MSYNNWVSSAKYDMPIYNEGMPNVADENGVHEYAYHDSSIKHTNEDKRVLGYIGPGPSCFIAMIDGNDDTLLNPEFLSMASGNNTNLPVPVFNTAIVNLQHNIDFNYSESEEVQQYYGFGNFFKLDKRQVEG